uniref:Uncharacterized protein n=1 Tax=Pithovirus LCPAC302 TaxID=2506593 RepID=A0A481Z8R2_9VIRU|nr:MAG: hypothetical protein LCPAC302_01190 [Pithovirus LCPAC302]
MKRGSDNLDRDGNRKKQKKMLEKEYDEIEKLKKDYRSHKSELKTKYKKQKLEAKIKTEKEIKNIFSTIVLSDKDRDEYKKIIKDWAREYVKNNSGRRYINRAFGDTGYLTLGDEDIIKFYHLPIVPPLYIRRIATTLGKSLTWFSVKERRLDWYGDDTYTVNYNINLKI